MSKAGVAGWAVAVVLAAVIVSGVVSGDDADLEREARIAAEARARVADDSVAKLWAAWRADSLQDARADSLADVAIAEAEERARLAEASANERTERLRLTLTREQQSELDAITAFWQETVRETEAVADTLQSKLARAEARAESSRALARAEQERAVRWRDSYEAATAEIEALRKPDFLSLELDDIPKLALTAGAVLLIAR